VELLPSDPEYQFVWKYFYHQQPTNRIIQSIYFIHNPRLSTSFESHIPQMELEAHHPTFQPSWKEEDPKPLRQKVYRRFEKLSAPYTPFTIPWSEQNSETYRRVKILPLWHGTSEKKCQSIFQAGFTFFGKHDIGDGASSLSTDAGYFGSGIYFTTSARYAADCYSDRQNLLLGWVAMREPYPVVNDQPPTPEKLPQPCSDMKKLEKLGHYRAYNAHYIPVTAASHASGCPIYYPCPEGLEPMGDEVVVFGSNQTLCRFWIQMAVSLVKAVSSPPVQAKQLLQLMISLADHPEIQYRYPELRNLFKGKIKSLIDLKGKEDLSTEDANLYVLAEQLLLTDQRVNQDVAHLLQKALGLTSPFYSIMKNPRASRVQLQMIPPADFIAVIQAEPHEAALYCNLARSLPQGGKAQLPNGTEMTQQHLFLKAIELNPNHFLAYLNLAITIQSGEKITLLNGTEITQQQLLLKAVELDPNHFLAYYNLAIPMYSGEKIRLPNGIEMTKQQLLLKTIELDPSYSLAYYDLTTTMEPGEKITLPNGTEMTQQQLYLKVIELSPHSLAYLAYNDLAMTMNSGEKITLLNGAEVTQRQLLLKAIELDPDNSLAYSNLALTIGSEEKIKLPNGTEMTEQQLFLKTIELDPNYSPAYRNLAKTIRPGEKISLPNGIAVTQQQLFLKVIELDPNDPLSYCNLANTMRSGEKITLLNGTEVTQQQLCFKAIELNPNHCLVYVTLATTMDSREKVTLLNGTEVTQQQLYLKAIELNPNHFLAYYNLAMSIDSGEKIRLFNGTEMTQQQLLLKAIALDPTLLSTVI
jgi:hypothetical protein